MDHMDQRSQETRGIVITGAGLASSLGTDLVSAAAASRAGVSRGTELSAYELLSEDDGEPEAMIGHPVGRLTYGFEGLGRLARLASLALADLIRQTASFPGNEWGIGFYVSLPPSKRSESGTDLIADEETRQSVLERAQENADTHADPALTAQRILEIAAQCTGWPWGISLQFTSSAGHAGVLEALERAQNDLLEGRVNLAIVGGVDSLLDEETVWWLKDTGRLKRSGVPAGLQPGEAAAFIQLETKHNAQRRGAKPLAQVHWVTTVLDETPLLSGTPPRGIALSALLEQAAQAGQWHSSHQTTLISDQNGELYRAQEWGNALVRLLAKYPSLRTEMWYQAASFGDIGAASGGVALSLAAQALSRGYSRTPEITIVSSSDGPLRAAAVLGLSKTS